jgi:hypothetical protein
VGVASASASGAGLLRTTGGTSILQRNLNFSGMRRVLGSVEAKAVAEAEARLQVAVAIVMPCQPQWRSEDEKACADDRLVYSIGLLEVPWRKPDGW